ncbi:hypothetical protein [Pandoraea pnomenusa]|uniref:hypothetical protein n=1 Tax=Pandoraea pnomenusa TaxID=93220 RepID=UPI0011473ACB|nr:hypothetical protein [Pandoraea pnomenusa]QDH59504.1 hypothetical protein FKQ53_09560 [Pandoraea pnomenusa]
MTKRRTSKPSPTRRERTSVPRLYKRTGVNKVSFIYLFPDGRGETLATAPVGDRSAINAAESSAKRRALDIQAGQIVSGSVGDMIDRFQKDYDGKHYRDQSKDGIAVRKSRYANLTKFFGRMSPAPLKMVHGYQYLDARAAAGAPASANKDMAAMQTICNYAVRWGIIDVNPFVGLMLNETDVVRRDVTGSQVTRFYLWAVRQDLAFKTMGCAAMFAYLTGFRAAEVRPFHRSGIRDDGVLVESAKRKRGEEKVMKLRAWSPRLKLVVKRAQQGRRIPGMALFGNRKGQPYTRSGWGSVWQDAQFAWIASFDEAVRAEWNDPERRAAYLITGHPAYFTLNDGRPVAITEKLERREADVFDFAAHADPGTTMRHYDRRRVKKASPTK